MPNTLTNEVKEDLEIVSQNDAPLKDDPRVAGNLLIGASQLTLAPLDDFQSAVNAVLSGGGGTVKLQDGTFLVNKNSLYGGSSLTIEGVSPSATIIDFGSTAFKFIFSGTNVYTTGTITSITVGGTTVTGSGTSWLANVVAFRDYFFLNGRWHLIAAVTGDTTLILAEAYSGPTVGAGTSYVVATPIKDVTLRNLAIKNSTGSGLDLDYVRFIRIENVLLQSNNIGLDANYFSELSIKEGTVVSSTSHAVSLNNGGLSSCEKFNAVSNGGSGYLLANIRTLDIEDTASNSNTADGFNETSCTDITHSTIEASSNGGQGIEAVSGNDNLGFIDPIIRNNTSDGIKFTATTDNSRIIGGTFTGNGGYGINIAASTCDNNTILAPYLASNTSGDINNSGTGTIRITESTTFKTIVASDCSAKARFAQASGGNGTITDSSTGINIDSGSGVIGFASIKWGVESSNQSDWFRGSPTFSCFIGGFNNATGGGVNSAFVGIGSVTVSAAGGHTFTNSHIGFKLVKTSNVTTLYATQADGTTENASSALTTIANGNILELICVVNGTTSVDYYWRKNGGALSSATRLTSNLPTANTGYFQFSTSTDNTTTSQTVFDVGSFNYSRAS